MENTENKMGIMPEGRLLVSMSLPMMVSMVVQAMYNIIDSVFVSQISENALTAVSLAFPIQSLLIAVATGTGVGVNSLLSKSLGEKNFDRVNKVAENGIAIYFFSYIATLILGIIFVKPFYFSQVSGDQMEIANMGISYLNIICIFSFGIYSQILFERILQATGRTFFSMLSQLSGAVINIILDPILIFGLLGMPKLGVAGAAIATVTGQIIAGCFALFYNIKVNKDIKISFKGFKLDGYIIKMIYKVGLPSIIMQSIGSVMTFGMNLILMSLTKVAAAVFGVYFKLQSFFFMPVFGLNNGIIPIVAYNYGAKNKKRMLNTMKYGYIIAFLMLFFGFLAFMFVPELLLGFFNPSESMVEIGVPALRIIGVHFLIAWFCIVSGSVFQAVGNGVYSLYVSVARQLVVLLPAAYILAKIGGVKLIWWSFPIAELMSLCISAICLVATYKKDIKNLA